MAFFSLTSPTEIVLEIIADIQSIIGVISGYVASAITHLNQAYQKIKAQLDRLRAMAFEAYTKARDRYKDYIDRVERLYVRLRTKIIIAAIFAVVPAWIGLLIFIAGIFCPFLTVNHVPPIGISFLPGIIFYIYIFFYKLIFDWMGYQIMKKATGDTSLGDSIFEIFKTIDIAIYSSGIGLHEWFCFTKLPDAVVDRYFTFDIGSRMPCIRLSILNDMFPIGAPPLPDILCIDYKLRLEQWQYPSDEGDNSKYDL